MRAYALGFIGLAIASGLANFIAVSFHVEHTWPFFTKISFHLNFWIQTFTLGVAGEKLTKRIRLRTFTSMLCQEIGWFDIHSTGTLATRLAVDASHVKGVSLSEEDVPMKFTHTTPSDNKDTSLIGTHLQVPTPFITPSNEDSFLIETHLHLH